MRESLKISVITCFYNAEKYVVEFVRNIEKQVYRNFELILVNDGSTDHGEELLTCLLNEYENIIYLSQENAGPGPARNLGLVHATGEYIYYLDIDDMLVPDALQELADIAIKTNADIITFNSQDCDEEFSEFYDNSYKSRNLSAGNYNAEDFIRITMASGKFHTAVWLCLFNRKFLLKANNPFLPIIHEDCIYIIRNMLSSKTVYYYDEILHWRRLVTTSITHKHITKKRIEDTMIVLKDADSIYRENKNKSMRKALNKWNHFCCNQMLTVTLNSQYRLEYRAKNLAYLVRHIYLMDLKCVVKLVILLFKR